MSAAGVWIAGLPLSAWLLLLAVIVIPAAIEAAFLMSHRGRGARRRRDEREQGGA